MVETQPNILVVEDDASLNEAYKTILTAAGYTTRTAFNGEEALKLAEELEPTIIFLDLRMPVMDGIGWHLELARDLARRGRFGVDREHQASLERS